MGLLVAIEMKWSVGLFLPCTRGHTKSILLSCSDSRNVINIGQKLAEKEPLGLNYITANPLSLKLYAIQEDYSFISKHPTKI